MTVRNRPSSWSIRSRCDRLVTITRAGGATVARASATRLRVTGELDVLSAPLLSGALADPAIVELDLSAISFIDASGLAVLVAAARAGDRAHLRLVDPAEPVTRLLELCGEVDAFTVWT